MPWYGVATAPVWPLNSGCAAAASASCCSAVALSSSASLGLADGLAGHRDLVLPGGAPVDLAGRLGDDGRDLRERVVVLLVQAGVDREDQVGRERGDALVLDAVGEGENLGLLRAVERLLGPREDRALVLAEPLGGADGDDAERQQRVLLAQADDDDPLGLGLDRGLAELVVDRDREGARSGRRRGRRGG